MRRRKFITLIAGGAAAWPFAVRAQQPAKPVVAFLGGGNPRASVEMTRAFLQGLRQAGYSESRNLVFDGRWAWGHDDQLPELAAALVGRRAGVIATAGLPAALAARAATTAIPIIFIIEADPIAAGLVASLERPAANLTGVAILKTEFVGKRLELLHQIIPTASTVGLLVNPTNPDQAAAQMKDAQAAADALGLQLRVVKASDDAGLAAAFATLSGLQAGGLVAGSDEFFNGRIKELVELASYYSVPMVYQYRAFTYTGGLIGYGPNLADPFQSAGVYAGRVLNGEKAGDLPVQQSTKVDLLINLKTAKTLGITIPPALLSRANDVTEEK
jgi:putative ABC transport system substrate-binding protein